MLGVAAEQSDLRAILAWAAGAPGDIDATELDQRNEERLLSLIDAHGLGARFAARLDLDGARLGPGVHDAARELRSAVHQHLMENAAAVAELSVALGDARGLVVLKGMAAYQLTRRPELMRRGDVDVLVAGELAVEATLRDLGYRRTRPPFLHELGEFTRGTTEIDLHEFFPVYAYTSGLLETDLRPDRHPGTWRQGSDAAARRVTYYRAMEGAREGRPAETPGVLVPGPELQVVVLCGHAFMNYMNLWSISHRYKPYVRLAELADVRDLVRDSNFDRARFSALVDELDAHDAVSWTAAAGQALLGSSPFPANVAVEAPALDGSRFPRCVWWRFWAELPVDADTLTDRWWLRMDRVVAALGAAEVGWMGDRTGRHGTVDAPGATRFARVITLPNAHLVPFCVEFERSAAHLTAHLHVQGRSAADTERVRVDLGDRVAEWIWPAGAGEPDLVGDADATFRTAGAAYEVRLRFPARGPATSDSWDVALLVGVTRTAPDGEVAASTLVPVSIRSEGRGA